MDRQVWDKYLPIIKILIKKDDPQTLDLNKMDFSGLGIQKSKITFKIKFEKGRLANIIHDRPLAVELVHHLQDDVDAFSIIKEKDMSLTLNSGFQLKIEPSIKEG